MNISAPFTAALLGATLIFSSSVSAQSSVSSPEEESAQSQKALYGVEISPDGRSYAILKQFPDQKGIVIYDADDASKAPVGIGVGEFDEAEFSWATDNRLLLKVTVEQRGINTVSGVKALNTSRWLSIPPDGSSYETLFGNELGGDYYFFITDAGALLGTDPGNDVAYFSRQSVKQQKKTSSRLSGGGDSVTYSLLSANLKNGRTKTLEMGKENTFDWVIDGSGDAVARLDKGASDSDIKLYTRKTGSSSLSMLSEFNLDDGPYSSMRFYGPNKNGDAIEALVSEPGGARKLIAINIDTGTIREVGDEIGIGSVSYANYSNRRAAMDWLSTSSGALYHLAQSDRDTQAALQTALAGSTIAIISKSTDGTRIIAKAYYAEKPTEYYLFDSAAKRLELIAQEE